MKKQDAVNLLMAKLKCMENDVSGIYDNCNKDCDNCELCYLQGTVGEQMEALKMAINAG